MGYELKRLMNNYNKLQCQTMQRFFFNNFNEFHRHYSLRMQIQSECWLAQKYSNDL